MRRLPVSPEEAPNDQLDPLASHHLAVLLEAGAGEHLLSCRRKRAGHRHDHPDLDRALCVGVSGKSDRNCENGGENALPCRH
jgi:hypothetical protein